MASTEEKYFRAHILERTDVASDLCKLRVDPGSPFHFIAGQYATLGVQSGEKIVERPYSIVSSPYEESLEFYLELVAGGDLTPLLFRLETGAALKLRKYAKGRFTLDFASGHANHLLICTVTGIAPYISYLRTFYRDWKAGHPPSDFHFYLINGASCSLHFGYRGELEGMASEVPWLRYVPTVSRTWDNPGWTGEVGRAEDVIRKHLDQWGLSGSDTTAYLCGHPKMIELGIGILKRRGFSNTAIRSEVYWVPEK